MTTVYVDKRAGILLTDSRITCTEERNLFGFIPLKSKSHYRVASQKALYIHDRLFSAAGNVAEINKIINFLIDGTKFVPARKAAAGCQCMLIGDNYVIHLVSYKGKFSKWVEFISSDWTFAIGSGAPHIAGVRFSGNVVMAGERVQEEIINSFKDVHKHDVYSDDNINLYRI